MNEEITSWVAAGDYVVFNISGVDISKIRSVSYVGLCNNFV